MYVKEMLIAVTWVKKVNSACALELTYLLGSAPYIVE